MSARFDTTSLVSQLGLGCYWAWVALAFYSNASMIGANDPGFWVESIWQYSTLFHGIALVAFAIMNQAKSRRRGAPKSAEPKSVS